MGATSLEKVTEGAGVVVVAALTIPAATQPNKNAVFMSKHTFLTGSSLLAILRPILRFDNARFGPAESGSHNETMRLPLILSSLLLRGHRRSEGRLDEFLLPLHPIPRRNLGRVQPYVE